MPPSMAFFAIFRRKLRAARAVPVPRARPARPGDESSRPRRAGASAEIREPDQRSDGRPVRMPEARHCRPMGSLETRFSKKDRTGIRSSDQPHISGAIRPSRATPQILRGFPATCGAKCPTPPPEDAMSASPRDSSTLIWIIFFAPAAPPTVRIRAVLGNRFFTELL